MFGLTSIGLARLSARALVEVQEALEIGPAGVRWDAIADDVSRFVVDADCLECRVLEGPRALQLMATVWAINREGCSLEVDITIERLRYLIRSRHMEDPIVEELRNAGRLQAPWSGTVTVELAADEWHLVQHRPRRDFNRPRPSRPVSIKKPKHLRKP